MIASHPGKEHHLQVVEERLLPLRGCPESLYYIPKSAAINCCTIRRGVGRETEPDCNRPCQPRGGQRPASSQQEPIAIPCTPAEDQTGHDTLQLEVLVRVVSTPLGKPG
eukprot:16004320-Heterocapsa_arctica.AAC.1